MDDGDVCRHTHTWSMSCQSMKQQNDKSSGKLQSPHRSLKFKVICARAVVALKPKGVCLGLFISCPDKSRTNLLMSAWVGWMSASIMLVLSVLFILYYYCAASEKRNDFHAQKALTRWNILLAPRDTHHRHTGASNVLVGILVAA